MLRPPTDSELVGIDHYSSNPDEPLMFYGGVLSNFVGGPISVAFEPYWLTDGTLVVADFPNVEVFYQADKAADEAGYKSVLAAYRQGGRSSTWNAKAAGQKVTMRDDWESGGRIVSMLGGLRAKTSAVPEYTLALLDSGERYIAEDSPTDFIWGIRDGSQWGGRNLLGICHMLIRATLRGASSEDKVAIIHKTAANDEDKSALLRAIL